MESHRTPKFWSSSEAWWDNTCRKKGLRHQQWFTAGRQRVLSTEWFITCVDTLDYDTWAITAQPLPTSVSLSAGVGRTGTIIALDVLLQQLDREKAVGINAFVHKMRLNRSNMVQTEVKLSYFSLYPHLILSLIFDSINKTMFQCHDYEQKSC